MALMTSDGLRPVHRILVAVDAGKEGFAVVGRIQEGRDGVICVLGQLLQIGRVARGRIRIGDGHRQHFLRGLADTPKRARHQIQPVLKQGVGLDPALGPVVHGAGVQRLDRAGAKRFELIRVPTCCDLFFRLKHQGLGLIGGALTSDQALQGRNGGGEGNHCLSPQVIARRVSIISLATLKA